MNKSTQSEFIKSYCENSNITEERLNELGQFAVLCECEDDSCPGWCMVSKRTIKDHVELYIF